MWDLIVSVPDHCLSFYFTVHWPVLESSALLTHRGEYNSTGFYRIRSGWPFPRRVTMKN